MKHSKEYEEGEEAARAYYNSQGFSSYTRFIKAEDAIRLFLPPVKENYVQMSTPLPKARLDWIRGFKKEQEKIINENQST